LSGIQGWGVGSAPITPYKFHAVSSPSPVLVVMATALVTEREREETGPDPDYGSGGA